MFPQVLLSRLLHDPDPICRYPIIPRRAQWVGLGLIGLPTQLLSPQLFWNTDLSNPVPSPQPFWNTGSSTPVPCPQPFWNTGSSNPVPNPPLNPSGTLAHLILFPSLKPFWNTDSTTPCSKSSALK
jgi:hypothetical protein